MSTQPEGLNRRQLLKAGGAAAAGAALLPAHLQAAGGPRPGFGPAREQDATITGGELEVGVFYEGGPWFDHCKSIGDELEAAVPDTELKYTFCNTASDPARALRWQNGDPLDVDTGRWNTQAPPTYDWVDNGFVYDMTAERSAPPSPTAPPGKTPSSPVSRPSSPTTGQRAPNPATGGASRSNWS